MPSRMSQTSAPFRSTIGVSHLPALDGLRAVAVFTVIASHAGIPHVPGDLGVSAFFVLSGFLITRLLLREYDATGTVSKRQFYLRRTLRIFPAYYAFLFVSYALDARAGQHWSTTRLLTAVTYTVNYFNAFNHHPSTSIAHAWSLGVEEQFYLLWPVVFIALIARGRRAVVIGLTVLGVAALAWRSWLTLGAHVDVSYVYNAFDTRFDNLAVGCLLAVVVDYDRVVSAAMRVGSRSLFPLATLCVLLLSRLATPAAYHYSIGFTIDALLVALLIVQLLQLYNTALWSWIEWPAVRYLGRISYPMYLYHGWGGSFGRLIPGHSPSLELIGGVIATIALASGSYYVIEQPFLKLKKRFEPSRRAHRPADAVADAGVVLVMG
jgi:peptidoglycan/LPS O-acetylase OafA/YrhL